ncbi:MAG: GntG family PLP-dependent aldolase [Acidobacteriota bacterium]
MTIDLRSDTVTRPDEAMRRAMAAAEVGDDVLGEDPTVRLLEEEAAEAVGFEASLFVPSGIMGNQIALHLHGRPGGEVICEARAHMVGLEMGSMAALSGLMPRPVASVDGLLEAADVERVIAPDVTYRSRTALLAIENTHNMAGGRIYRRPRLDALLALAKQHGLPVHLDGARIFNAAVALGVEVPVLTAGFDTMMFCLSKGLGAPVGSLLCGGRDLIHDARRVRRMFGGGMRQVGVLAAAGLVALHEGPERLAQDHENARWLAGELAGVCGLRLDPQAVETNIVVFGITADFFGGTAPPAGVVNEFLARLRGAGVLASPGLGDQARLVTHRDVSRANVEDAARRIAALAA